MQTRQPPHLDMLPDGRFREPARSPVAPRVFAWAVIIAVVAGALSLAAFALWVALLILPVAFAAAAVAWLTFRVQAWRIKASTRRGPPVFWGR